MLAKIVSFGGRIGRLEFFLTLLVCCTLSYFIRLIAFNPDFRFCMLLILPVLWVFYAQGAKRCHDLGYSGFCQLIPFSQLFMLFIEGSTEDNEYGESLD